MIKSRYCHLHLKQAARKDRESAERALEQRHAKVLQFGGTEKDIREARAGLRRLARIRLHRMWKHDPRIEGETISITNKADRERVHGWILANCGIDVDQPLPGGRMLTPRAMDRCLWAGWRVVRSEGRVPEQFIENAKLRVRAALRDDDRFWVKWGAAGDDFDEALEPFNA